MALEPMTPQELSENYLILQKQVLSLAKALAKEVEHRKALQTEMQRVLDEAAAHLNTIIARLEVVEDRATAAWLDKVDKDYP